MRCLEVKVVHVRGRVVQGCDSFLVLFCEKA